MRGRKAPALSKWDQLLGGNIDSVDCARLYNSGLILLVDKMLLKKLEGEVSQ